MPSDVSTLQSHVASSLLKANVESHKGESSGAIPAELRRRAYARQAVRSDVGMRMP